MKILVVGGGGREHALCWKLLKSKWVEKLYCAPGNAGISQIAECVNIQVNSKDYIPKLLEFSLRERVALTIVGPEAPLVEGIVNHFTERGLQIFGPTREAAQIEGSKAFAKEFMTRYGIPTPEYQIFDSSSEAKAYISRKEFPLVVKADGLAAGKGTFVCKDWREGVEAIDKIMVERCFGDAGEKVIVEEFEEGEEVSILAFSDGETFLPMVPSQDHKQLYDDDKGPNTGGMGAYSPAPVVTHEMERRIRDEVLEPTFMGLLNEGFRYVGVLYAGLILTRSGPKVLEYNCRFGDPEAQAILPLLETDLIEVIKSSLEGKLSSVELNWREGGVVCVVLASSGYPGSYEKGKEILGLREVEEMEDVFLFHAGTKMEDGKILTNGGRVLSVTAHGENIQDAIERAYLAVSKIHFDGMHYRRDIAHRAKGRI
jgi:phosphoribosylamine--glycine ligase